MSTKMMIEEVHDWFYEKSSQRDPDTYDFRVSNLALSQHEELERLRREHDEMRQLVGHLKEVVTERDAQLAECIAAIQNEYRDGYCFNRMSEAARALNNIHGIISKPSTSAKHNAEILRAAEEHYASHLEASFVEDKMTRGHYFAHHLKTCEVCQAVRAKKAGG
jgi:hypothetical protein